VQSVRRPGFFYENERKASTLQTKGGEQVATVVLRPNESQDSLLRRFRKKVVKSGVLSTIRRKRWFVSKSENRRVERKKSMRRIKRRQMTRNMMS
jgi:small subunit ribosomal protein S21